MANIKILKNTQHDINSTNIWRFAFHSDYKTLKIVQSGKTDVTLASGSTSVSKTIAHSLGYEPSFFVNILKNGKLWETYGATPCSLDDEILSNLGNTGAYGYASVDNNNLYVDIDLSGATPTNDELFTIEYIIFLDQE